ncbi:hypothetical protein SAMN05192533_10516 [Mesobacillus persicus]|uniref:Uncharacterized protein n=1 Tax=Mesobacillus persicus TaxID=930146 RepID=A0A1H8AH98_9BACI|nr:hypothetical protein [Mesobacillus persicus]SEM70182.1 hypothetical protein SAMN05192533_10516 [Mesobacillus persicus]
MSSYNEFLEEKTKIDSLIEQGYQIASVRENLSGAFVEFAPADQKEENITLHILTADARKHFSNIIIANHKKTNSVSA